jgi:hypothetical protein
VGMKAWKTWPQTSATKSLSFYRKLKNEACNEAETASAFHALRMGLLALWRHNKT